MAGGNAGIIENCYATGNVSGNAGTEGYIGGIVGVNTGLYGYCIIKNCYATGNVNSTGTNTTVGGVAGLNLNGGIIQNCYATGDVQGDRYIGGVVGSNQIAGTILQNCVALNNSVETPTSSLIGRIVGDFYGTTMNNNYGRDNMTISTPSPHTPDNTHNGTDGADVTTANAILQTWWETTASWDTSSPWNWTDIWNYPDGLGKLPTLKNMPGNPTQNPRLKF